MVPYALPWRNDPLNTGQRRHRYARGGNRTKKELRHVLPPQRKIPRRPTFSPCPSITVPHPTPNPTAKTGIGPNAAKLLRLAWPRFLSRLFPSRHRYAFCWQSPGNLPKNPYRTYRNIPVRTPIPCGHTVHATTAPSSFFCSPLLIFPIFLPVSARSQRSDTCNNTYNSPKLPRHRYPMRAILLNIGSLSSCKYLLKNKG